MKLSEKYFKKMQPQCMECGGNFNEAEVRRYGRYCDLEGALDVGLSDVRLACEEVLDDMAQEDNLINKK